MPVPSAASLIINVTKPSETTVEESRPKSGILDLHLTEVVIIELSPTLTTDSVLADFPT
jgi:hypothetical protein